jgi:cyclophilin family peptidyl-prolyl cis-trans isomerase
MSMASCSFSLQAVRLFTLSVLVLACTSAAVAAPNAPTNLRCAVTASNAFTLIWDDNSTDETSFDMLYAVNGGGGNSYALPAVNGTGTTNTGFSGISGWVTATFQIRANNASGSSLSNTVSVSFAAFGPPSNPLSKPQTDGSVIFMWTDNAYSEAGYFVEIGTAAAGPFSVLGNTGADYTGLISALAPSTTYYFRVRGFQGTAASPTAYTAYSSVASVTTPVLTPPTSLTATAASEGTVNLSWVDNSVVEGGYGVYYRLSGSGSFTLLTYTAPNATTYSFTGLTAGTAYDFRVTAAYQSTSVIESAPSNTASATTKDGFTSGTAPPIFYNQAFSYQAVVSTGSSRNSWSITGLPAGLTFSSSTGAITGTPTATGAFNCPMSATFANGWTANNTLQLRVIRAPAAPVSATTIGTQSLTAGGNTSVALGDKFADPDSESAVRIVTNLGTMDFILFNSATPQAVANFLGYVNAAVNNYNGAVFHRSVSNFVAQGGAFKVQSAPNNFSVTPTSASPPNEPGISNLRGTVAMAKIGGNPDSATDQFFVNLGNNSSNLDRDSGSPNANGGFTAFARVAGSGMTVADAIGNLPTATYTVNLGGTSTSMDSWPLTSASAAMDTTKVVAITSAAPVAVLSYAVTGNTNSAVASATINGTNVQINALAGGQTNVTVAATDLDGSTVSQTFTVTVNQAPAITSSPPPAGLVSAGYNFSYTTTGFPAPTFSVTSGALPAGLSLSTAGVLSGTPTTAGTFIGTVTASNGIGTAATQNFSITVNQVPAITSSAPSSGVLGTAYNYSYTATGAPVPTYSMTGTLPTGLSLSAAGVISGTPTAVGTFTGTVTATNLVGTSQQAFSITINQAPAFTNGPPPGTGVYGTPYTSFAYTAAGSPAPTFNVTAGALPTGLSLSTGGVITGTPTAAGTFTGTVTASNGIGTAATQNFSIIVAKAAATVSLGGLAQTFDNTPRSATATTTPASLAVNFTYDGSSTPPTNAGSYAVVATINDSNYAGTASGTLVVAKATATVNLGSLAQTYDGGAKSATATTTPSGLTVNFTYDGSSTAPTNAGTYAVIGTLSDVNYSGSANGSLVIAKAAATVSLGGLAATYNGSAHSATATTTPAGLSVSFTYDGSATAPTNAGNYAVAASINDTNYQGTASGSLAIAKAAASVSLGSLAQTYDGTPKPAGATTTPANLVVSFTYDGSATAPTNAGSYAVIGTVNDTNYSGSSTGTLAIAKGTATLALNGLLQTYDGSPKPVSATTTPAGLAVILTYNGSATAPTNHGSYVVAASINDTNYGGTAGGTLTITGQSAASWRTQHFSSTQISAGWGADDVDPDGDGLKNLAEYALGTDPWVRNASPAPILDANGLTLNFTRPKDLPNVSYAAEATDSLGSWNPITVELVSDGAVQTMRARDPLTSGNPNRRFIRLVFTAVAN